MPHAAHWNWRHQHPARAAAVGIAAAGEILIAAVESFQGRDRDFVCVSFVRSGGNGLGFVSDPRRLCVALTRARLGLYLVGNPTTLAKYSTSFDRMLLDCAARGFLVEEVQAFGVWRAIDAPAAHANCGSSEWQEQVFRHTAAAGAV